MYAYLIVGATFSALGGGIFLIAAAEIRSWSRPSTSDADGLGPSASKS
jgi:hypothetical protein